MNIGASIIINVLILQQLLVTSNKMEIFQDIKTIEEEYDVGISDPRHVLKIK